MKTSTLIAAALLAAMLAGCSNGSEPEPTTETPASGTSSSTPSGESDECMAALDGWVALYDALDESSTLEDPSKETSSKVVDDSADLLEQINASCSPRVANSAVAAHDQMLRVDRAITACEFSEMCGSKVDDELDATMQAVDEVRTLTES